LFGSIGGQILLILLLILANGLFAMSEIAIVSARRTRLQQRAERGDERARRALELAEHPNRFLSTVQIGITLIGIFAGAYGGARLADPLSDLLARNAVIAPYADTLALALVVATITFFSLVLGELVPKRIALTNPETIATKVAGPMNVLAVVSQPLVRILSFSTDVTLRALGVRKSNEPPITEEEVAALIEQGAEAGVFEQEQQDLVEHIFALGDRRVSSLMVPRRKIVWLDLEDPPEENRAKMAEHRHTRFIVCRDGIDQVLGMVDVKDLWAATMRGEELELTDKIRKPLFVPENMNALDLLDQFRTSGTHLALVLDEYGGVEGLVTLNDIVEDITGDLEPGEEPPIVQREDGSWLVDAAVSMDEFWETLDLWERRGEERPAYHTVGGFVVERLGHIPRAGEYFEFNGLRIEVIDMDGHRVDKVLVSKAVAEQELQD